MKPTKEEIQSLIDQYASVPYEIDLIQITTDNVVAAKYLKACTKKVKPVKPIDTAIISRDTTKDCVHYDIKGASLAKLLQLRDLVNAKMRRISKNQFTNYSKLELAKRFLELQEAINLTEREKKPFTLKKSIQLAEYIKSMESQS